MDKEKKKEYDRLYHQEHRQEHKERDYQYRQEHKREQREYERQYNLKTKWNVFSHYSNGTPVCAHCGIGDIDILTIDHINGGGSKHRKSLGFNGGGDRFYGWLKRNGFPEEYQVLCYNCNIKRSKPTRVVPLLR